MVSKRQKESNKKYNKEKMLSIAFRLNKESDAELIAKYQSIVNKTDWFRKALREVSK